ncbi:MAG: hypothetical protein ACRD3J_20015 [Thermoanaerobaculia bacterium]
MMGSDIFFPRATFLSGAARTFDLWGHLDTYSYSRTEAEADALALYSDWRIVGEDIFQAITDFAQHPEQLELFPQNTGFVEPARAASTK